MIGRLTAIALVASIGALTLGVLVALTSSSPTSPPRAEAAFHIAEIDEIMTSYDGDSSSQFVEIEMLATGQQFVAGSTLAAWDASGSFLGAVFTVPGNVSSGTGRPWLMGTSQFETDSGLQPDFTMPGGLPTGGGMVCWGIPSAASVPDTYVDCVAYGTYSGPGNAHIGSSGQFPAPDDADGHSLERTSHVNQSASDFECADPATPENNTPTSANMTATTACAVPTPTPTPTPQDSDGDGVPDSSDNCPNWPNPSQNLPPWTVPAGDTDCDGWSTTDEGFIGTDPTDACGVAAWPPDYTDDMAVDIFDINILKPAFFSTPPGPPYDVRLDLTTDGSVDIFDVNTIKPVFFLSCIP